MAIRFHSAQHSYVNLNRSGGGYVANGQVFVYSAEGKEIGRIDMPDRPIQILFGAHERTRCSF